nr:hypothetical protein [Tanacetum cinerariifolium]GEY45091.1 hypothetical protein [Tanacetum cinerariifolium]
QSQRDLPRNTPLDRVEILDDEDVQDSDDEPQHADDERTESKNQETDDDKEETEDEFVHTPPNYIPTDDVTNDESNDVTEEEYERINEELYGDVNVSLIDVEPADKEKDDEEMTVAGHVNVNEEGAEYLGSSLDDALHKVIKKNFADIIKEHSVPAKTVERLWPQYAPQKSVEYIQEIKMEQPRKQQSFNKSPKKRSLYHALMESILKDKDAIDEGDADKLKKRKPDDAGKDEGLSVGSNRGLKRRKISKDTKTSKKAKSIESSKGTSKSQPKSTDKSTQVAKTVFEARDTQGPHNLVENMGSAYNILKGTCRSYVKLDYNVEECYKALIDQLDWNNPEGDRYPFDLSKPLPLVMLGNRQVIPVDYFFNNDLAHLQGGSTGRTYTNLLTKTKATKYDLPGLKDMVPHLWSPVKVAYDKRVLLMTNVKVKEWYGYGHLEKIEVRKSDQQLYKLFNLKGDVIVHLAAALLMFTRSIVIQKRVEGLQIGVKSYQKKLNISRPMTHKAGITDLKPYSAYSNPQGFIYVEKLGRNRLMCSHELYKFSGGTLISLYDTLKDMANNLEMG